MFSPVVINTSDACCIEEPPPCTEDVGGTWGRCVSQSTSESHSSVCTDNLMQHSIHDTNHVHRVHSLPFTELPMVDPLSVWSTCCPSLERECLRWMKMVRPAFTVQLSVVASQWWGTSWTSVDLTSAWELQWVVEWYMTLCDSFNLFMRFKRLSILCTVWLSKIQRHCYTCTSIHVMHMITHTHTHIIDVSHTYTRTYHTNLPHTTTVNSVL